MARARERTRDRDRRESLSVGTARDAYLSDLGQGDEAFGVREVTEGEPDGFGVEASSSNQVFEVLAEYSVPRSRQAELDELTIAIEANGEAFVTLRGSRFGPYSAGIEVSVPFRGATLVEGDTIRVYHRSTDGVATTTRAQGTLRLY